MKEVFHPGELEVQERAGVRERAAKVGRILGDRVGIEEAAFLSEQRLVVLASIDSDGRPWASPMTGSPGFVRVEDPTRVTLAGAIAPHDPIRENLRNPGPLAVLAIELETRSRYRVNGVGELAPDGTVRLAVREAFGNCRKYIQVRELRAGGVDASARPKVTAALDEDQRLFLGAADTVFLATIAETGADASHRGGNPGFVRVGEDGTVTLPDYVGNNMFQSLGNVAANGRAGLLAVEFTTGRTLQLTGRASIDWEPEHAHAIPGAQRLLAIVPERVVDTDSALGVRGRLIEPSPFNP